VCSRFSQIVSAKCVLLSILALVLATLAADILHWHHDVLTLEDYEQRYLRPVLSAEVDRVVLRGEEHIHAIRRYGGWSWSTLGDLSSRSWIDPFVLKELGHVLILGLAGVAAATDAYVEAGFEFPLVLLPLAVGIFSVTVWASYWSVSIQYLTWKQDILPRAWAPHVKLDANAKRHGRRGGQEDSR
jgi:hypothetical protein